MDSEDAILSELCDKLKNEADKLIKHITEIKAKGTSIVVRAQNVLKTDIKKTLKAQAVKELQKLIYTLIEINLDLELGEDKLCQSVIPYLPVSDDVINLKFLSGDSPWNFWLSDERVDVKEIQKILLQKYQTSLLTPHSKASLKESVCFFDRKRVCRGIVIQEVNEHRVKVLDCDSDSSKLIAREHIFEADPDACCIHASVIKCTIAQELTEIENIWNIDMKDIFCNALRESILKVKIIERLPGVFPKFVVDIQLQNEDDDSSANLNEWIVNRLIPEIKKLTGDNKELLSTVCDFLSLETLNPFFKTNEENEDKGNDKHGNNCTNEQNPQYFNNLNCPSHVKLSNDKLCVDIIEEESTKVNVDIEDTKHSNGNSIGISAIENSSAETENTEFCTDEESIFSTSSDKDSNETLKNVEEKKLDSRLKSSSEEFHPKQFSAARFLANRNQPDQRNSHYSHQVNHHYPSYKPPVVPWTYQHTDPVPININWSHAHVTSMPVPPSPAPLPCASVKPLTTINPDIGAYGGNIKVSNCNATHKHNVMAPEFVPKNKNDDKTSSFCNNLVRSNNQVLPTPKKEGSFIVELKKPTSLIEPHENFLVLISHVESPSEFYVHFVSGNNKFIDKLLKDMFDYYTKLDRISFLSPEEAKRQLGRFCACLWPEDNYWYRVEVLDWHCGENQVKVFFVDHGNKEIVPLDCLQPLLNRDFTKLSMCAQLCHLAKIHPLKKGEDWSKESIQFFKDKVSNKKVYSVTVIPSNENKIKVNSLSVLLHEGKATSDSISINDSMVDAGMAWSKKLLRQLPTENGLVNKTLETDGNFETKIEPAVPSENIDFEDWDPQAEDYFSPRNNPAIDTDDACVAVSGYSARDEARICKFFAQHGFCWKSSCIKEHSLPSKDGVTTDKGESYDKAFSEIELPSVGQEIKVKITSVTSINSFYVQLQEDKGRNKNEEEETLTTLEAFMNKPESVNSMKFLKCPPTVGELVLVKEADWWYRARVSSIEENFDLEVLFVDYGSSSTISGSQTNLRAMEPRYLHLPFQAIECSLANIRELELEDDNYNAACDLLRVAIEQQILTAKVYESVPAQTPTMEVSLTSRTIGDVGDYLVSQGFAEKV